MNQYLKPRPQNHSVNEMRWTALISKPTQSLSTYLAGAAADQAELLLRVEQAICTNGDCNALLVPCKLWIIKQQNFWQ